MVGAITGTGGVYRSYRVNPLSRYAAAGSGGIRVAAARRAQPGVPVQPAEPVKPVRDRALNKGALLHYLANDPVERAVRGRIQYENQSAREAAEEGECETCKRRKYQDGSDDPGVSFKTAARVDPNLVQAAVRGHENEHVVRERAKALQDGRRVISQSVSYHNEICPECGKVYLAGGTTRTVTASEPEPTAAREEDEEERRPQ